MPRNRIIPYNPNLKYLARELRRNMSLSEILLWERIRRKSLGYEFHRQVPIDAYIVDFYCHELFLAIELDGSSHISDERQRNDIERQTRLESLGVKFLRFDDRLVKRDMNEAIRQIVLKIEQLEDGEE